MNNRTRKQKRRVIAGALQENGRDGQEKSTQEFSLPSAGCQLSPDSLSRAAFLIGDLGCWLLARCPKPKPPFDPEFNPVFFRALDYLDYEDILLRRARRLELEQEVGR